MERKEEEEIIGERGEENEMKRRKNVKRNGNSVKIE